jgi:S-DNA-T family DNA segregation ATPase FtsK/SpoIIIE
MAANGRKPTTRKRTSAKPKTAAEDTPKTPRTPRAKRNDGKENTRSLVTESVCILVIALSLILGIILLVENQNAFGVFINEKMNAMFGYGTYLLPLFFGIGSFAVLFDKVKRFSWQKIVMGITLYLLILAFIHILNENGGGFGAFIGSVFIDHLPKSAAYILIVSLCTVLLIMITGKSLFGFIVFMYGRVSEWVKRIQEERRMRLEEDDEDEYEDDDDDEYDEYIKDELKPRNTKIIPADNGLKPLKVRPEAEKPKPAPKVFDCVMGEGQEAGNGDTDKTDGEDDFDDEFVEDIKEEAKAKIIKFRSGAAETDGDGEKAADDGGSAPWDTDIQVKGIGVEGYVHETVKIEEEIENDIDDDDDEVHITKNNAAVNSEYVYPPIELLRENPYVPSQSSRAHILENSRKLEETLKSFGVEAKVVEVCVGPTVTRYELSPSAGVKVSKISGLSDDLALNLAAEGIRIEAPVPGKPVVGIEIPNKEMQAVYLRDVIDDDKFWSHPSKISFAIGKDIAGNTVIADIAKMPHLLVAGATGAGKSVCINTLVASIIYKANPNEVKLIMIDPKVVELSVYNGIPHLLIPVVTDPKKASGALNWAVREMELRYALFADTMVRDLKGYNDTLISKNEPPLPQIVIIIDELADLMMTCGKEVEESICRLAQKARAAGIHLIIATQRPSVDVITGLIKANVPSRLAFAVASGIDSRTILNMNGAERLLGKGDMLFAPVGLSKPQRIQGSFVSDKEVESLVGFIKRDGGAVYDEEMIENVTTYVDDDDNGEYAEGDDEFTNDAIDFIVSKEKASVSMLQRRFRIGYNRAARLMDELEQKGIVGPEDGSKPRKVLVTYYQWQEMKKGFKT